MRAARRIQQDKQKPNKPRVPNSNAMFQIQQGQYRPRIFTLSDAELYDQIIQAIKQHHPEYEHNIRNGTFDQLIAGVMTLYQQQQTSLSFTPDKDKVAALVSTAINALPKAPTA